jgi:DNA-binding LacI/PurR family transcriptional regulator
MTTMREIAHEAGVSASTVSRVLNGQAGMSDEVARRVLAAADALGYRHRNRPRLTADRALRQVGFLLLGRASIVARPFYASLLAGASTECEELDMAVTYFPVSDLGGIERLPTFGVDAVIIGGHLPQDMLDRLSQLGLPFVIANERADPDADELAVFPPVIDRVVFDDAQGGRLAAGELLKNGHERLAVFHEPFGYVVARMRVEQFCAAIHRTRPEATITLHEVPRAGPATAGNGYEVARSVWAASSGPFPTGVFCTSGLITGGVMSALRDTGRPVPDQVSVVGFHDSPRAATGDPPLTTVAADGEAMGRAALRRLLERAREPEGPSVTVVIGVELVRRHSVGPPP